MTLAGFWPRRSGRRPDGRRVFLAASGGSRRGRRRTQSAASTPRNRVALWLALAKPRLNALAVATVGIGYYLGAGALDLGVLLSVLVGSGLVAAGGAAFNQVAERDLDALMIRTRSRPLPLGGISPAAGQLFATVLSIAGLSVLAVGANPLSAVVALATLVSYAWIYTPLKRRTSLAVLVGAVPGALPPVIGWAAATGALTVEAWLLFGIVFAWQLPHFHSLAWLHRDDYARAGFKVLAVADSSGRRTALESLSWALLLVVLSTLAAAVGLTPLRFAIAAAAFSGVFVLFAMRFASDRSRARARTLFLGSLVVLPLIWITLVAGHATL
ncbi:MAG: heme o synthase [Acidobacteria bacterium]|nr:heme o synthase [Acidobacteriota bacterium]